MVPSAPARSNTNAEDAWPSAHAAYKAVWPSKSGTSISETLGGFSGLSFLPVASSEALGSVRDPPNRRARVNSDVTDLKPGESRNVELRLCVVELILRSSSESSESCCKDLCVALAPAWLAPRASVSSAAMSKSSLVKTVTTEVWPLAEA